MPKQCVLYISYDGILEALGISQVFQYLRGLSPHFSIVLITFEKRSDVKDQSLLALRKKEAEQNGIHWIRLPYHKRPSILATLFDVVVGTSVGLWVVLRYRARLIHARSYVAGLMAWFIGGMTRRPYLFDMRGFWPEEKVEAGAWKQHGVIDTVVKRVEQSLLRDAHCVITLTEAAKTELQTRPKSCRGSIKVIPTCADLKLFRPSLLPSGRGAVRTLGYVGSVLRYRFDVVVKFYLKLSECAGPWRLIVINHGEHQLIEKLLNAHGVSGADVQVISAVRQEMPEWISQFHAAAIFADASFSKLGTAPTRLAELLGCGIPTVVSEGLGDAANIVERAGCGVVLRGFDLKEIGSAAQALVELIQNPKVSSHCRSTAEQLFSLERGVEAYRSVYEDALSIRAHSLLESLRHSPTVTR